MLRELKGKLDYANSEIKRLKNEQIKLSDSVIYLRGLYLDYYKSTWDMCERDKRTIRKSLMDKTFEFSEIEKLNAQFENYRTNKTTYCLRDGTLRTEVSPLYV